MQTNSGAWLTRRNRPLEVRDAPFTSPSGHELVVRNHAVAINPYDWIIQAAPVLVCSWMKFPFILGSDLAGEVIAVGPEVTRFKIGDRVVGHALGVDKARNDVTEGAFQNRTVLLEHMTSPIPTSLSYESACVLPLGLSTAACALFQEDHLALQYPSRNAPPRGETLLVWGGSTSVGSNAIQLAVAAGYEVVTTASPANFEYVSSLGAAHVFDYNGPTVTQDLIQLFSGKLGAGAIAIGANSVEACVDVVQASEGRKFVSIATFPLDFRPMAEGIAIPVAMIRQSPKLLGFVLRLLLKTRLRGIRTKAINGTTLAQNEVGEMIYGQFLPAALAENRYIAAPKAKVIGRGLSSIQVGLNLQRRGVSAEKIVVSL